MWRLDQCAHAACSIVADNRFTLNNDPKECLPILLRLCAQICQRAAQAHDWRVKGWGLDPKWERLCNVKLAKMNRIARG